MTDPFAADPLGPHPATQTITFTAKPKGTDRDDDGNAIRTPGTPRDVPGLYSPGGSVESTNDEQRVISQERVIIPAPPADLVVNPTDQVQVASEPDAVFEVSGRPRRYAVGLIVPLERVTG